MKITPAAPLYVLWFLATASDAFGSLIAAIQVFRSRDINGGGRRLAWALVGLTFEALVAAGSLILWWPTEITDAPYFALSRACGRSVKSVLMWRLALYMVATKERTFSERE